MPFSPFLIRFKQLEINAQPCSQLLNSICGVKDSTFSPPSRLLVDLQSSELYRRLEMLQAPVFFQRKGNFRPAS